MTGATVETVSRVMSRFADEGLVTTGRKWVEIRDFQSLERIAKEGAVN
jgi:CRP-like cAMP-binding protein